jgi:hypothetical protein
MADLPREIFRGMLTALAKQSFEDLSLNERAGWLPGDVREAIAKGWVIADGPDSGMFGRSVQITEVGRRALADMPYPPT